MGPYKAFFPMTVKGPPLGLEVLTKVYRTDYNTASPNAGFGRGQGSGARANGPW